MSSSSSSSRVLSSSSASEVLKTATFSFQPGNVSTEEPVTASDLLMAAYDPARLHPLADLSDKLDYLLLDDDKTSELPGARTAIPSRGWSDDLCYGTGTMYLSGKLDLFQLTLFEQHMLLMASFSPWTNLTLSRRPSNFRFLIVLFHHMFIVFYYRLGHRRCLGCTGGCPTTPSRIEHETAD